jgi:hypothetical protein
MPESQPRVMLDNLMISWSDVQLGDLLGKGGQGKVYKARWRVSGDL